MEIVRRISELVKSKARSKTAFASLIGLPQVTFNNYMLGKRGVSYELIEAILKAFPDVSSEWLLRGKGDMYVLSLDFGSSTTDMTYVHEADGVGKLIPYYDAEAAAGLTYGMDMSAAVPVAMIAIGDFLKDSECAIRVYGDSMLPGYPPGCVIGVKLHTDNFIEPGTVYVLETEDNRYIKRLYYTPERDGYRCISDNTARFEDGPMKGEFVHQDFVVPMSDVKRLYRVTGVVKRDVM